MDGCDAVTIAGVGHPARFAFMFGGNREFDTETVMIDLPNLELAGRRCPGAIDLVGRDTRVIGGLDRDN